jgi:phage major head subunit gpT-like protein
MHGVYARMVADLGNKAAITRDTNAYKIFRGAFTTTLTADGVSFINAAHPLIGGGTTSNLVSGALTTLTLNDAIIALGEQKDQAGVVIGNEANILLVPFALYKKAQEITQSVLIADSANNNINVYSSIFGIKVMTTPYMGANAGGSDTAWFLLSRNHSVYRYVRQALETSLRDWSLSNNRTYFYQANFREEVDVIDYVGCVGSTGL